MTEQIIEFFSDSLLLGIALAGLLVWYGVGWLISRLAKNAGAIAACRGAASVATVIAPTLAGYVAYETSGLNAAFFVGALTLMACLIVLAVFARNRRDVTN